MAKVYYSSVLDLPSDDVWAVVRDFNNYPAYIDGVTENHIEDNRAGDAVGAVRSFVYRDRRVRQRLLAHSDVDRSFSYGSCEPFLFPTSAHGDKSTEPIDYQGTLRVTPVVEMSRAFVEWWVTFEGGGEDRKRWTAFFEAGLRQWMASLNSHVGDTRPTSS
jgi:hypothetical protein